MILTSLSTVETTQCHEEELIERVSAMTNHSGETSGWLSLFCDCLDSGHHGCYRQLEGLGDRYRAEEVRKAI